MSPMRRNESLFFALLLCWTHFPTGNYYHPVNTRGNPVWQRLGKCHWKFSSSMEKLYGLEQGLQRLVWSVHSRSHSLIHSVNRKRNLICIKLCKILPFEVGLILKLNCLFCDIHRDSKLGEFSGNLKSTLDSVLTTFLFATLEAAAIGK